jgi:hypothetical protein
MAIKLSTTLENPEKQWLAMIGALETYLRSLSKASQAQYRRQIENFRKHEQASPDLPKTEAVMQYFAKEHEQYSSTTIWGHYSMIEIYLKLTHKFTLEDEIPQLKKLIQNWEKHEEKKK